MFSIQTMRQVPVVPYGITALKINKYFIPSSRGSRLKASAVTFGGYMYVLPDYLVSQNRVSIKVE